MDADRRIIPLVEDDQGEGMMDPIDDLKDLDLGSTKNLSDKESIKGLDNLIGKQQKLKEDLKHLKRVKSRFKKAGYNH